MWKVTYSQTVQGLKRDDVWRVLTNVNDWPRWQGDLDDCQLDGTFEVGHHFFLKPKGSKPVKIVLTDVQEGVSFTDCTTFLGARMYDTHAIEVTKEGLKLTNTLVVKGPLKWLWVKLVAQDVAASIPKQMDSLIKRTTSLNT